jgi:hypothetical protein
MLGLGQLILGFEKPTSDKCQWWFELRQITTRAEKKIRKKEWDWATGWFTTSPALGQKQNHVAGFQKVKHPKANQQI